MISLYLFLHSLTRLLISSLIIFVLILTSVIFIIGLSGISINLGSVSLKGMGLATVVGLILNLAFLIFDKLGIMNEPAD